jgi:hypothetical protein
MNRLPLWPKRIRLDTTVGFVGVIELTINLVAKSTSSISVKHAIVNNKLKNVSVKELQNEQPRLGYHPSGVTL